MSKNAASLNTTMDMVCYQCCNKGKVTLGGNFDKNQYSNGDKVTMNALVENNSLKECRIYGQCFLDISLSRINTGMARTKEYNILVGEFESDVIIPPNTKSSTIPLQFVLTSGDNQPTCLGGDLIQAKYRQVIRVKAKTCCNDGYWNYPFLETPILVGSKHQQYKSAPFEVSNWAPQTFKPVVFTAHVMKNDKIANDQSVDNQPILPQKLEMKGLNHRF